MAERKITDLGEALRPYVSLLQAFVISDGPADDFERAFNALYLADNAPVSLDVFEALDGFFVAVDSCVADPGPRDPRFKEIGPEELRERAADLLRRGGYGV